MFQYHCGGGIIVSNVQLGGPAQRQNAWTVPVNKYKFVILGAMARIMKITLASSCLSSRPSVHIAQLGS